MFNRELPLPSPSDLIDRAFGIHDARLADARAAYADLLCHPRPDEDGVDEALFDLIRPLSLTKDVVRDDQHWIREVRRIHALAAPLQSAAEQFNADRQNDMLRSKLKMCKNAVSELERLQRGRPTLFAAIERTTGAMLPSQPLLGSGGTVE